MGSFVFFAENEVSTQAGAPTAVAVESILHALPVNGNREFKLRAGLPGDAGFVGNARVTRVARIGLPGGRVTRVAWLYAWPDPPDATPEQNARLYADVVRNVLSNAATYMPREWVVDGVSQVTGWKPPVGVPYDPAIHGAVEWWESPTGSVATATRDTFDLNQQTGGLSTIDNPIGPTTNRAPDFDPFGTSNPNGAVNRALGVLETLIWGVSIVAGLYFVVGPIVGAVTARKNPRGFDRPRSGLAPATVRRVWKAVEDAKPADRSKVAHAFSRARLLSALSWNDRDGDYDQLDQDTLADAIVYAVDVGGGETSDIGSRR